MVNFLYGVLRCSELIYRRPLKLLVRLNHHRFEFFAARISDSNELHTAFPTFLTSLVRK